MDPTTATKGEFLELKPPKPTDDWSTTVIVVPDIGNPHDALSWTDGMSCWLFAQLPSLAIEPRVFQFRYGPTDGQNFSWDYLVQWGDALLDHLLSMIISREFASRPLIFICHGLGGLIAKRTLGTLSKNFHQPHFEKLLRRLAGQVYLGTPHPTFDKPQEWSRLSLLLKACTKLSWKAIERNAAQISATARISRLFDDAGFQIPVLSIYEGKPTKISSKFMGSKREVLVDLSFARIGLKKETLVKVDASHNDLCMLPPGSPLLNALTMFFKLVEDSFARSALERQSQAPGSIAAWTTTAASEGPGISDPTEHSMSQRPSDAAATAGMSSDLSSYEMIPLVEGLQGVTQSINLPQYLFKPYTRDPDFHGREDVLQQIKGALAPPTDQPEQNDQSTLRTFALCGAGGLGKTQIAVEFAYANKDAYDAIFIMQASDSEKLAQSFSEVSVALGLERESSNQIVSKNQVLGWLSEPVRQIRKGGKPIEGETSPSWLLIFDNADDLEILRDFWPDSASGSILVTSRDPLAKTKSLVSISNGIDLDPFTTEEGGRLLRDLTGYSASEDVGISQEIAARLSGLPLALTQIARTISRRDLSFQEFLMLYDHDTSRSKIYQSTVISSSKTLYTTWNFQDLSPPARSLLNVISFFDPDQISEGLLLNMGKVEEGRRPDHYPDSIDSFIDARSELYRSSLIKRNRETKELTIHRIIQDTARSWLTTQLKQTYVVATSLMLYETWPFSEFEHSPVRWRLCEPIVPHVAALHRLYKNNDIDLNEKEVISPLARLFMDFGQYFLERGNIGETHRYFESCTELCDLDPESTHMWRGYNEGRLAQVASLLGDYRTAIVHAKFSAEIFEQYDDRTWRLRQAYNELAEAYLSAGRYEDALEQAELGIKGPFNIAPDNPPDFPRMSKAYALINLGRHDEASDVLEEYLRSREERFGPMDTESFKTGLGLYFSGKNCYLQQQYSESLDFYLKALAQYHSTIGPDHFRVATLYDKLGEVYVALEQFDEALVMFEKSVKTFDEMQEYLAQMARALYHLANTQQRLGLEEERARTLRDYEAAMGKLSEKYGRKLEYDDLKDIIRNHWD